MSTIVSKKGSLTSAIILATKLYSANRKKVLFTSDKVDCKRRRRPILERWFATFERKASITSLPFGPPAQARSIQERGKFSFSGK